MEDNKTYRVKNRSASTVVVRIPEISVRREFAPGQTLMMTYDELTRLSYQPGGRELMANFLQVMEDEVNDSLGVPREAEYYMTETQIIDMLKTGSLEQFEDCLDFAPIGVIDLVKQFAVSLPLTDTRKISALKAKTGFDVERAIANAQEDAEDEGEAAKEENKPGRRTNVDYKATATQGSKYKVVKRAE